MILVIHYSTLGRMTLVILRDILSPWYFRVMDW